MTPQALKASILQLAIQGKLVPQRPEEGTAEDLYQQIQAEKQRLIAEGKIKKEKPLPPIEEDKLPFDIPETWKWVRLGEVLDVRDGTHDTPKYVSNGIPLVTSKNLKSGSIDFSGVKYISTDDHIAISKRSKVEKNDILFAMIGSIGNATLCKETPYFSIKNMALFKNVAYTLSMEYVLYFLIFSEEKMKQESSGGVQSFVSLGYLRAYKMPLPPLAEQKRIVAKIEEMLPLVERYGEAYEQLQAFNKRFPDDLRKSILQEAIQGKLVPQLPEEGTAEDLYQQIQAEKKRLIASGTIKKEKPLPPIEKKDLPFDIPETWKWVKLDSISTKLTDGSHNPPPKTESGYRVISAKNIKNGVIVFESNDRFCDQQGFNKENPRTNISKGDIILGIIGGSIGNVAIYQHDDAVIAQRSIAIINILTENTYLKIILESSYCQQLLAKKSNGSAQGGIYLGELSNLLIPLPPREEQKRIVAKIEELLTLCKSLQ